MDTDQSDLESPAREAKARVLLVDDDARVLAAYSRVLTHAGFAVVTSSNGADATTAIAETRFDAVISDINMPGMDGIQLLRAARERDLDLPVLLITGAPGIDTAIKAVEYGALRYLIKPVDAADLERIVRYAVIFRRMADLKRQAFAHLGGKGMHPADRTGLEVSFQRAVSGMWMAYQPIVRWSNRSVYGYEALMRSSDAVLYHPQVIVETATRLGRLSEMGLRVRQLVAQAAATAPPEILLFINCHPAELFDESLYSPTSSLASEAHRCVIEITERASLDDWKDARERIAHLRMMNFRVAVDDLGAGHAGLSSIALIEPEIVKLDMSLVRNLDKEPVKRRLVKSMVDACQELGMDVIAEGIETSAERDALVDLGCELMQGYLFAPPGPPFPRTVW